MSFDDVRLPARLAFGSTGGVERRTEIVTLASGFERRSTPPVEPKASRAGKRTSSKDMIFRVVCFARRAS